MKKKLGPLPVYGWALIGGGLLLVLYLRSRSSSSSTSSGANTAGQVDPSNPLGLTYAQETADLAAGIDPNTGSTFASESAASGASGGGGVSSLGGGSVDLSPITSALQDLANQNTDFQNQISGINSTLTGVQDQIGSNQGPSFGQELTDVAAGITALHTIFPGMFSQPAAGGGSSTGGGKRKPLTVAGAIRAPSGKTKPDAPKGMKAVGLGSGAWEFVPVKHTVTNTPTGGSSGGAPISGGITHGGVKVRGKKKG